MDHALLITLAGLPRQVRPFYGKNMITKIKSVLTPDLLKPAYRKANKTNPMFGHCYAASEAAFYLFAKADG